MNDRQGSVGGTVRTQDKGFLHNPAKQLSYSPVSERDTPLNEGGYNGFNHAWLNIKNFYYF